MAPSLATVLVVDDDAALRESLSAALDPPFRVVAAATGKAARGLLLHNTVDLALIDYVLPDTSGLRLLESLQRLRPELPIILITGFGSEDLAVEAFRSGIRDYLKKPFTASELLRRVSRALLFRHSAEAAPAPCAAQGPQPSPLLGAPGGLNQNLERAIRFVDMYLDDDITLTQVAQEAGMSKFHFCRVFRHHIGLTFREFVARRRIGRALELLRDGQRSVTEVCFAIGFKNLSHFGRVFRQLVGRPPSAYRRSVATAGQCPRSATRRRPEKQATSNEQQPGRSKQRSSGLDS
jgi:YesN/AraC family two-component response regulator